MTQLQGSIKTERYGKISPGCFFSGVALTLLFFVGGYFYQDNYKTTQEHYRALYCRPADFASERGDYVAALSGYQQFLKRYPDDPDTYHSEALTFIRMGQFSEARIKLAMAIDELPRSGKWHNGPPLDLVKAHQWQAELEELDKPNVTIQQLSNFRPPPLPNTNRNHF